jgi:hypothetical protein
MTAAPPALSGFASRSWLASIQADSLKSGCLSRSAMCKVQARQFSQLPGNRGYRHWPFRCCSSPLSPLAVPLLLKPRHPHRRARRHHCGDANGRQLRAQSPRQHPRLVLRHRRPSGHSLAGARRWRCRALWPGPSGPARALPNRPLGHAAYVAGHAAYVAGHAAYVAGHAAYVAGHAAYVAGHAAYVAAGQVAVYSQAAPGWRQRRPREPGHRRRVGLRRARGWGRRGSSASWPTRGRCRPRRRSGLRHRHSARSPRMRRSPGLQPLSRMQPSPPVRPDIVGPDRLAGLWLPSNGAGMTPGLGGPAGLARGHTHWRWW